MVTKYRIGLLCLSIIILAGIVWYANPAQLMANIVKIDYRLVAIAFLVANLSIVFRVLKWSVLLENRVGFRELLPVQLFGMTISNFTPGKVGDPIKSVVLKLSNKLDVSKTLPSVIWERIADIFVLVALALSSIALMFQTFGSNFMIISFAGLGVFAAIIAVLLTILHHQKLGKRLFGLLGRLPGLKITPDFTNSFYQNARTKRVAIAKCGVWTFLAWVCDALVFYLVLLSLGTDLSPILLMGIFALSVIIGIASFLPGGLGSTEVVMVLILGMFGVANTVAVSGILVARFLTFWYVAMLGGASFLYLAKKVNLKF